MLSFKQFQELSEHVLSIGLNPSHEKYREQHRTDIHDMLKTSYSKLGGYSGHTSGSPEESKAIHHDVDNSMIKATRRNGKITSVSMYKNKHGRKLIAAGTDGSEQGKKDYKKTVIDDHNQQRSWGEVSGAIEHIKRKIGVPIIHNKHAEKLTGKEVEIHPDEEHYTRKIGNHPHTKVIMGHPKVDL